MSARYYTLVSSDLLREIRSDGPAASILPAIGLRLVRVVEAPTPDGYELVEFRDDGAPAELNGRNVTFTISEEWAEGERKRAWISTREVVDRW